jgi:DNA-binding GntR family transcriptional regulator
MPNKWIRGDETMGRSDEAFKSLREDIVTGELHPKVRLVESEVAKRLGISRTPVREALKMLEAKGYVTILPRGGVVVTDHTPVTIRNLFEIREALETMAIKLACQRRTERQVDKAEEYHKIGVEAAQNRDINRYADNNSLFHEALLEGCGNEQLLSLIRTNRDQYFDRRLLRLFTSREWRSMIIQHGQMVEAVRQQNVRRAQNVVRDHVKTVLRVATERL